MTTPITFPSGHGRRSLEDSRLRRRRGRCRQHFLPGGKTHHHREETRRECCRPEGFHPHRKGDSLLIVRDFLRYHQQEILVGNFLLDVFPRVFRQPGCHLRLERVHLGVFHQGECLQEVFHIEGSHTEESRLPRDMFHLYKEGIR